MHVIAAKAVAFKEAMSREFNRLSEPDSEKCKKDSKRTYYQGR